MDGGCITFLKFGFVTEKYSCFLISLKFLVIGADSATKIGQKPDDSLGFYPADLRLYNNQQAV